MPTTLKTLNQLETTINGTQNSGRKSDYSFDLQNPSNKTGESNQEQADGLEEQMTAIKSMLSPRTNLHQRDPLELLMIICGGVGLAFNSGLMNGITLTAHEVPTSHVTGTVSHAGMMLAEHNYELFIKLISMIAFFLAGSILTGMITTSNAFQLGSQ